jgi:amino acid adenylation domain-containing protein
VNKLGVIAHPAKAAPTPLRNVAPDWSRIDHAFAGIAAASPDAIAVSCGDQTMTYGALDELGNRIAHALRVAGITAGERVALLIERSPELVAVILGILKAGCAYVPLEPDSPGERTAYTMIDSGARIAVVQRAAGTTNPSLPVLPLTTLLKMAAGQDGRSPPAGEAASDEAYVIYTSGSTGRPKGVRIRHASVLALVLGTRVDFGMGPADVWTLFHSIAFDFSVWEIWGCLLTGGRLVVIPYWVTRSPEDFRSLVGREGVTVLNLTPSAFAQFRDADRSATGSLALRLLILGGESLDCRALAEWFDRHDADRCRLVNMYGITETTVHVTAETITRDHIREGSQSVGRPLPGWQVHVLDGDGMPQPIGMAGEIYVGGVGLAIGYVGRDDLTLERFAVNAVTGERLYRSGDRGRLLVTGELEHLGRIDNQVKIRGFRIEPGEIRAVLSDHPAVSAAAVVVRRRRPDDAASTRIDAYVTLSGGTVEQVRAYAALWLPKHMLPDTLTCIARLPLTRNGKLDTDSLPEPDDGGQAAAPAHTDTADGTSDPALEAALARIWASVIGRPVGMHDNFFDLGGNSIEAARIVAAIREEKLGTLPVRELYIRRTVRNVAAFLTAVPPSAEPGPCG